MDVEEEDDHHIAFDGKMYVFVVTHLVLANRIFYPIFQILRFFCR